MGCVTSHPPTEFDDSISPTVSTTSVVVSDAVSDGSDVVAVAAAVVIDPQLQKEAALEANRNVIFDFGDIEDDKHAKYMDRYVIDEEFWGLGIENETYLVLPEYHGAAAFRALKLKPERYSVTYTTNFKPDPMAAALQALGEIPTLRYPVYVNAHTLQKTDTHGNHRTFYDANGTPNPAFTESVHDVLMREVREYRDLYDMAVVFDGDTIEFITQRFYRATVSEAVKELVDLKRRWLAAVAPRLARMPGIGRKPVFPEFNHGLVTFLTTRRANLGICNSGTIHVNLTLPTALREGRIADKDAFAKEHLAFVQHVQLLEPLFAACYGTPDVFSLVDPAYSLGSLRLSRSRYVSLQTFDAQRPVNGKLLLGPKPAAGTGFWYDLLADGPYFLNATIGYDINFNKFKNHGVEVRFLDWFPERYLEDVVNVFVLLGALAVERTGYVFRRERFAAVVARCVQRGFAARLDAEEVARFWEDLGLSGATQNGVSLSPPAVGKSLSPLALLQQISDALYDRYAGSKVVAALSPGMARPRMVDYNREAHRALVKDVFGPLPELVIRCEENPAETRTPLRPADVAGLMAHFRVSVESSPTRCDADADYRAVGAQIVPRGYWMRTRESVVVGLKGLAADAVPHPSHTLLHFAHCFKGQEGSAALMRQLAPCRFIDYEFIKAGGAEGQRLLSFCAQSGKIGAYLALMAYHLRDHEVGLPRFQEARYRGMLSGANFPTVLLIGHGTVGKAAKAVLDSVGAPCVVWDSKTMRGVEAAEVRRIVRGFEIILHAIRLPDRLDEVIPPFLLPTDLDGPRVICDISCDLGNPRNTLPIYTHYTSETAPVQWVDGVQIIAIPHLPSLEPVVSSQMFSERLARLLPAVVGAEGEAVESIRGAEEAFRRAY
jgi:alanine dehydrogenase